MKIVPRTEYDVYKVYDVFTTTTNTRKTTNNKETSLQILKAVRWAEGNTKCINCTCAACLPMSIDGIATDSADWLNDAKLLVLSFCFLSFDDTLLMDLAISHWTDIYMKWPFNKTVSNVQVHKIMYVFVFCWEISKRSTRVIKVICEWLAHIKSNVKKFQ